MSARIPGPVSQGHRQLERPFSAPFAALPRRVFVVGGLVALASRGSSRAAEAARRSLLYVQPLGRELPDEDVRLVRAALSGMLGRETQLLPRVELPRAAFYPPRGRYRAERLLDFLETRLPADGERILGLTDVDISTTKDSFPDWGVMGLGRLPGVSCVLSAFRCRKKALGAAHARQRLAKVAVHEVGHTLGLPHCPTAGCLMHDAEGRVVTVDSEDDFCARCRGLLREAGRPLPNSPTRAERPWPAPSP